MQIYAKMIPRLIHAHLAGSKDYFPISFITGPRQSGKTTLIRELYSDLPYFSLENPDTKQFALEDPRTFLSQYPEGAVLDESQHVPELFSYLQQLVDEDKQRRYVLSGSQNFLISERISQSLAGRVLVTTLLPFSAYELKDEIGLPTGFETLAWKGGYPRIYDQDIPAPIFHNSYIQTYIERDVRQLKNIGDLTSFTIFLKLCAGRVGQLVNLSSLANDAGISVNTAKSWISVLEASYILFKLPPYFKNFNKQVVKMPKIYFYDTGLLCHLLGIPQPQDILLHFARGGIFENFIISEAVKSFSHHGRKPDLYFWRDSRGHEVDLLLRNGVDILPVEIKSGKTLNVDFFKGLKYWHKLTEHPLDQSYLFYGGEDSQKRQQGQVYAWKELVKSDFQKIGLI